MMKRPHIVSIIYCISALIFGVLALLNRSEALDIVSGDTYVVLPETFLWLALAILFILFAAISLTFELAKKPMFKILFGIHYLLTIAGLAFLYYFTQEEIPPTIVADYDATGNISQTPETVADSLQWAMYSIYALVGAQIIFGINILISLFRNRTE